MNEMIALSSNLDALIVIPCFNEETHIGPLLLQLIGSTSGKNVKIVVVDGNSTDRTAEITRSIGIENPMVVLLNNPKRIQSAGVNLAIRELGAAAKYLIRIDAHADYPEGYVEALLSEANETKASSVVVSMLTVGRSTFQRAVAAAQNSKLGNGGSAHRLAGEEGKWVEHGHHALMDIAAFKQIGGYDEAFRHNEDAELDTRLRRAGYKIWLTSKTSLTYYPRDRPGALFRQYLGYGYGRARNIFKHRTIPKIRQMAPVAVFPAFVMALLAPVAFVAALPFLAWGLLCMGYAAVMAFKRSDGTYLLSGVAAMIMHMAWSIGFWRAAFDRVRGRI